MFFSNGFQKKEPILFFKLKPKPKAFKMALFKSNCLTFEIIKCISAFDQLKPTWFKVLLMDSTMKLIQVLHVAGKIPFFTISNWD